MVKKILLLLIVILTSSTAASARSYENIEIFDISRGNVIKELPSDNIIQREARSLVDSISGVCSKFNPIPDRGYMVKIPLECPYLPESKYIDFFIDEVIIILPEGERAYLMIIDNEDRMLFFTPEHEPGVLLKKIDINLSQKAFTSSKSLLTVPTKIP